MTNMDPVELDSPYGKLVAPGGKKGTTIEVPNGTRGELREFVSSFEWMVHFPEYGVFRVPQHWLKVLIPVVV
jgi:hypothetical protein